MKMTFTRHELPSRARPARHTRPPNPRRAMIAAGALAALLLAGCASGSTTSSSEGGVTGSGSAQGGVAARDSAGFNTAPGAKTRAGAPVAQSDVAKSPTSVAVGPKLTKTASLDLQVKDISVAAARVRGIASGLGAQVLSEQIGKGDPGNPVPLSGDVQPSVAFNGFGTLTLSVPADKLDAALDQLAKIGTVLQRNSSSQDVTSQYVDTQSRLKTMRASVARVRALMAQAGNLGQVVALEGELSRREADLESLQSQLDALTNAVERSTLAVSLSTPSRLHESVADNGFLAGLRSGWDAFTDSARGLLTGVGAVLPFAVFVALIGAPLWRWWRRRMAQRSPAPGSLSGQPAPSGPTVP